MTVTLPAANAMMPPTETQEAGDGRRGAIAVDLSMEAGDWPPERVLSRLAETTEISIVLTDDAHIRALNREWREKDKATNVLSFPAMPVRPGVALPPLLGDIVLAAETIRREAGLEEKPFEHHLIHLMVHGFLHIVGYDHETDAEAEEMEAAERRILARLAIPDPYG